MLQNKYFGFCLLLLLLFRTGLDCKMDGTEKGGARERNPVGVSLIPFASEICRQLLHLLLDQKGKMKRLMLIGRKLKGS